MANSPTYTPWEQNQNALYAMAALNDATNTDIRPFINSGGKLILWHGGNDAALSVNSTAEYVDNMRNAIGATNARQPASTLRQALITAEAAPERAHRICSPRWTSGARRAPRLPPTLTARKLDATGAVTITLPLCQHRQYPRYSGPANDAAAAKLAANYTCTAPGRDVAPDGQGLDTPAVA